MANPKTGPQRVAALRSLNIPTVNDFLDLVAGCANKRDLESAHDMVIGRWRSLSPEFGDVRIGGYDIYWVLIDACDCRERELSKIAKAEREAIKAERAAERAAGRERVQRDRQERVAAFMGACPAIDAAMLDFAPHLVDRYANHVRVSFRGMVEKFGPELTGARNGNRSGEQWINLLYPVCRRVARVWSIDDNALRARAIEYATSVIDSWRDKISGKVGMLESASVHHLDGARFIISGTVGGRSVVIEQDMIVNFSALGTPFTQFPARIYLDGRFVSEAQFKREVKI